MIKLILEEAGTARTFRLGDGVLTVGSGEAARLRVTDPSVAEIHLELELQAGSAEVRVRPGVVPPRIEGAATPEVTGACPLELGQVLTIGNVRIWIEAEEPETPGSAGAQGEAGQAGAPGSSGKVEKQTFKKHPSHGGRRSKVQRGRPRVQRGLPAWAITAIVLLGTGLAIFGGFKTFQTQADAGAGPVWAFIERAERDLGEGLAEGARASLDSISANQPKTKEEEQRIAELYLAIEEREGQEEIDVENLIGTKFLDVALRRYEEKWLIGSPQPKKIRLFLKRCAEFRRRWPEHPELAWVDRLEKRFAGSVDITEDPTWDDLDWEIKYLVAQHWRNYKLAFELIYSFLAHAEGSDFTAAQELEATLRSERKEYFDDRLQQARYEYDVNKDTSKSVGWLLHLVIWTGDEEMADEAAGYLVKIPSAERYIRSYEVRYPERYAAVLEHPRVRVFARKKGLL